MMMTCVFCLESTDDIVGHLYKEHDYREAIETWPDDKPVIIDLTLEPKDFE